mgnify:CR=1 FL=1
MVCTRYYSYVRTGSGIGSPNIMVADGSTVDATEDSDTALENTELPALIEGNLLQMQCLA